MIVAVVQFSLLTHVQHVQKYLPYSQNVFNFVCERKSTSHFSDDELGEIYFMFG
jgi:hypothetical protein